jgi:hypothetical protein
MASPPAGAPAQLVDREVARRAQQPGAQALGVGAETRHEPRARERLLAQVLGGLAIADERAQAPRHRRRLRDEELVEGGGREGHHR